MALVTTSKALVTRSDALVPSSVLQLPPRSDSSMFICGSWNGFTMEDMWSESFDTECQMFTQLAFSGNGSEWCQHELLSVCSFVPLQLPGTDLAYGLKH